jgi:hypothetical protein
MFLCGLGAPEQWTPERTPLQRKSAHLKSNLKLKPAPAVEVRLLDIKMSARYLSTTVWFLRTCVWNRRVPFLKLGHRLLFDRRDLDIFVEQQKTAAR